MSFKTGRLPSSPDCHSTGLVTLSASLHVLEPPFLHLFFIAEGTHLTELR